MKTFIIVKCVPSFWHIPIYNVMIKMISPICHVYFVKVYLIQLSGYFLEEKPFVFNRVSGMASLVPHPMLSVSDGDAPVPTDVSENPAAPPPPLPVLFCHEPQISHTARVLQ
jgi:hypothetical protein